MPHRRLSVGARGTRVRWSIFWLLFAVSVVNFIDRGSLSIALPAVKKDFGLSDIQSGYLLSAFFWAYAVVQLPCAWLLDRLRPRALLTATAAIWGVLQACTGLAGGLLSMVLCRGALGIAEGPFYPVTSKVNATWLTRTERARGAQLVNGGAPLGNAIGALVMTALIALVGGWRNAFFVTGAVGLAVAGLIWWYVRDRPAQHPSVDRRELELIAATQRERTEEPTPSARPLGVAHLVRQWTFWWMFVGWFCYGTIFFGLLTWGPEYLAERGFGLAGVGGATVVIFSTGFVGSLAGGWIADRWMVAGASRGLVLRTMFTVAGLVSAGGLVAVTLAGSATSAVVWLSIVMFFWQWVTMYWSLPPALADPASNGKVGSLMNIGSQIGAVLSPIVVGYVRQLSGGFVYALYYFVAISVLFVVASNLIRYHRGLAENAKPAGRHPVASGG